MRDESGKMIRLRNAMEIFKILPGTNCRDCGIPTCLAFAAAVFRGDRRLDECPHIKRDVLDMFSVENSDSRTLEREEERALEQLKLKVADVDLASSAQRLDAVFSNGALTIKCLGKDFHVDSKGKVISDVHVHGWIAIPLLDYVLSCSGKPVTNNWVPFRELRHGAERAPLFARRCEEPLRRIADKHTDLFEHMIHVFSAKAAPNAFDSDIAVILHPLPRLPLLICYWKPDGDMDSSINVFFDESAEENLTIDSIYRITAGLVMMFEKIAVTHDL